MQRIKLFKGVETEIDGLESEINAWLESSGVSVVHMFGNIAPQTVVSEKSASSKRAFETSDLFLAIVYEA